MLIDLLSVVGGLALLVLSGDALVKGAVNLSLRLGIPPLIVGLTVVAFGTSAPELLVSVQAVGAGAPGSALGNVVGSNIANILLVLGVPATIATIHSSQLGLRRSYLAMLLATVFFVLICLAGPITRLHALLLLVMLGGMLWDNYRSAKAHRESQQGELEGADASMAQWKIGLYLIAGMIGLPLGADFLVDGATNIARAFGISEVVIGMTLVAVGTSLPELATSVIAAFKKQAEVAMGNVIGSNMFNLLGIIGVAGMVGPIPVPDVMLHRDLWFMIGVSLLLFPFILMTHDITRKVGIVFVLLYAGYSTMLVLNG
ncbi:MAG: calcium/sodium antiporter [Pseudorhodobacter sp.]